MLPLRAARTGMPCCHIDMSTSLAHLVMELNSAKSESYVAPTQEAIVGLRFVLKHLLGLAGHCCRTALHILQYHQSIVSMVNASYRVLLSNPSGTTGHKLVAAQFAACFLRQRHLAALPASGLDVVHQLLRVAREVLLRLQQVQQGDALKKPAGIASQRGAVCYMHSNCIHSRRLTIQS